VRLAGLKAGVIGDMTITGKNSLTVKDVAAGEVWVCSGQSNMEMDRADSKDAPTEIAAANFPLIRHFLLTKAVKEEPTEDCNGKVGGLLAADRGRLHRSRLFFWARPAPKLNAPVGLIHTSWGGTPAEFWTPTDVIAANPTFKARFIDRWAKVKADYPQAKAAYDEAIKKWKADIEQAKTENKPPPPQPGAPRGGDAFGAPGCLYNAMIVPVLPYTIQGVIWYQGESNASEAQLYRALFPTMIVSWRRAWSKAGLAESENPEFPFLFVQLANFMARHEEPTNSQWPNCARRSFLRSSCRIPGWLSSSTSATRRISIRKTSRRRSPARARRGSDSLLYRYGIFGPDYFRIATGGRKSAPELPQRRGHEGCEWR
jgi:sialate O-acetylesterase